jgi:hypothetical protein
VKTATLPLIFTSLFVLAVPCVGSTVARHYHPKTAYAEADNREGIAVSVDFKSGSTTQTYDVPLRRAGVPANVSLTADEAEEECDYKIAFQGKRYRFIRDTCIWSMRLDRNLELFLFDAGMEYTSSANYLDKRFRFSVIAMQNGAPTERQCTIIPGDKLGLIKAGVAVSDGMDAVVEKIAQRVGSGQLSSKDYNCVPARAVHAMDTSRFDSRKQRNLAP